MTVELATTRPELFSVATPGQSRAQDRATPAQSNGGLEFDGDGSVSMEEAVLGGMDEMQFRKLDAEGDGRITKAESKAYIAGDQCARIDAGGRTPGPAPGLGGSIPIECYAFACPPVFSSAINAAVSGFITTVVNSDDMVCRVGAAAQPCPPLG